MAGFLLFVVRPGGGLVIEGAGFPASVQDVDEPVRRPSRDVVAFDSVGAEVVGEGAGAGRGFQGGEGRARARR